MRADYPVVLDACVLAPANTCDLLLRLAETPRLYVPQWSEDILAEVRRTQVEKLKWPEELARYWQEQVRASFPEAVIGGYEKLTEVCENDPKDRHVLAAAIKSKAELIVTSNLKHFPRAALEPWGISAVHPSSYLITLYAMDPGVVVAKLEAIARRRKLAPEEMLGRLAKSLPAFARHVADALGWDLPST